MRDEHGFAEFAAAHTGELHRQAYLLTGSVERADRVAAKALADVGRRWDRLGGAGPAAEHARRALAAGALHEHGSRRRSVPAPAAGPVDDAEAAWRALAGLPARRRAALVLRYAERLDDAALGDRLGVPAATAAAEAAAGLAALRSVLRRRGAPEDLLPAALDRALPGTAPAPPTAPDPARRAGPAGPAGALRPVSPAPDGSAGPPGDPGASGPAGTADAAGSSGPAGTGGGAGPGPLRPVSPASAGEGGSGGTGSAAPAGAAPVPPAEPERDAPGRPVRRRRWWMGGGAVVAVLAIGAAVLVPTLGDDPADPAYGPVPAAAASGAGLLDWSARGPLAGDEDLLRTALRTWRDAVPDRQRPAEAALLYAGTPDGAPMVVLQGRDAAGLSWVAEVTDGTLRAAEPLGRVAPVVAVGTGGSVRLLAPAGADVRVRTASVPVDGPLRPLALDADGLSEPIAPAPAGLPVVVLTGGAVTGSGTVLPGRLSAVSGTVEIAAGTLGLGPAEVQPMWFGDGALLARRLGGPVTVAGAGPVRTTTVRVGARGRPLVARPLEARAYETVRAGTRYLAAVVRIDGRPVCVEAVPVGPAAAPAGRAPVAVLRCRPAGAADGVLVAVGGAGVRTVKLRLPPHAARQPARFVTLVGAVGDGLAGLARVPDLPPAAAPAEARDAAGAVVARFTVPAYRGPRV